MQESSSPLWYTAFVKFPNLLLSKLAALVPEKARNNISAFNDKAIFFICTKKQYDSWTLYSVNRDEADDYFSTCEGALQLLFKYDPRRYLRVKKFLKNIALAPVPSGFSKCSESCFLDHFNSARQDAFAADLVHEATHGYLLAKGLSYDANRRRHEQICLKEEQRSAERLFAGTNAHLPEEQREAWRREWRSQWKIYFKTCMETEWWTPHKRDQARLDAIRNLHKKIT